MVAIACLPIYSDSVDASVEPTEAPSEPEPSADEAPADSESE